ncbi:MAG: protein-L-isoaspartate(D-aspartate) O-methyltransferase [Chloroflexota bacterium]
MIEEEAFARARQRMVVEQLRERDITDRRVLEAMAAVPRHEFVPPELHHLAYADGPLPIGYHQTISQPYIVALMLQLAGLRGDETVLEVGTGSGYQAALLARLAQQVYTIEYIPELAHNARQVLQRLGVVNVEVIDGDGSRGLAEHAPYPAIVVAAAAPRVPQALKDQLADGGRLVIPVGGREGQVLERWRRKGDDFSRERITPVAFVPLVGDAGWTPGEGPFGW